MIESLLYYQYILKKPWLDKYYDVFINEIIIGNLNPSYFAATIDRYLFQKDGIKYGSFLPGNFSAVSDSEIMKNNRKEIGALSSKVFFYRLGFKHREFKS